MPVVRLGRHQERDVAQVARRHELGSRSDGRRTEPRQARWQLAKHAGERTPMGCNGCSTTPAGTLTRSVTTCAATWWSTWRPWRGAGGRRDRIPQEGNHLGGRATPVLRTWSSQDVSRQALRGGPTSNPADLGTTPRQALRQVRAMANRPLLTVADGVDRWMERVEDTGRRGSPGHMTGSGYLPSTARLGLRPGTPPRVTELVPMTGVRRPGRPSGRPRRRSGPERGRRGPGRPPPAGRGWW